MTIAADQESTKIITSDVQFICMNSLLYKVIGIVEMYVVDTARLYAVTFRTTQARRRRSN